MKEPDKYGITITKGEFEGEVCFRATVRELPDIAEFADSADEAYELARDSIETTAEVFNEKGRTMPAALPDLEEFSGRVTLRLPKTIHKSLAESAVSENVSLNQYMVTLLSSNFSFLQSARMMRTPQVWEVQRQPWAPAPKRNKEPSKVTQIPIKQKRAASVG